MRRVQHRTTSASNKFKGSFLRSVVEYKHKNSIIQWPLTCRYEKWKDMLKYTGWLLSHGHLSTTMVIFENCSEFSTSRFLWLSRISVIHVRTTSCCVGLRRDPTEWNLRWYFFTILAPYCENSTRVVFLV